MNRLVIILIIIFVIGFLSVWGCSSKSSKVEKFTEVLGTLANYKGDYKDCMSWCNRTDPRVSDELCDFRCNSEINKIADSKEEHPIPRTNLKVCIDRCNDASSAHTNQDQRNVCVRDCLGQREVIDWCLRRGCAFSAESEEECIPTCVQRLMVNNTSVGDWTWAKHTT